MRVETTGIAGLPADGTTMVSGLPTAHAEEAPPPDWPLTVVMAAIAVVVAFVLISSSWGEVDGARPAIAGAPELPAASASAGSYLEPANFRGALDEVGRRAGTSARVQLMRVDAGQVWVVLDVKGRQRVIRVTASGVQDDEGGDASSAETPLSAIDTEAPQRIVRGLEERFGVGPEKLDYVALAGWTGTWNAFLKTARTGEIPTYYSADARGRKLVRAG